MCLFLDLSGFGEWGEDTFGAVPRAVAEMIPQGPGSCTWCQAKRSPGRGRALMLPGAVGGRLPWGNGEPLNLSKQKGTAYSSGNSTEETMGDPRWEKKWRQEDSRPGNRETAQLWGNMRVRSVMTGRAKRGGGRSRQKVGRGPFSGRYMLFLPGRPCWPHGLPCAGECCDESCPWGVSLLGTCRVGHRTWLGWEVMNQEMLLTSGGWRALFPKPDTYQLYVKCLILSKTQWM